MNTIEVYKIQKLIDTYNNRINLLKAYSAHSSTPQHIKEEFRESERLYKSIIKDLTNTLPKK